MKFLANENFPKPSINIIRNAGFDVLSVGDSRPSISDEEVVKWAKDDDRVILTFDKDYGEIVFRYKIKCGVIFFRDKGDDPTFGGLKLLELLRDMNVEDFFTVIDKNGVRQRELKF
jgi:hypothetical protein